MTQTIDPVKVEAFAGQVMGLYTGAALSLMIDIGHRTGLFEAAAQGPATSAELAERSGLQERYVREWLGALTTGGVFTYDTDSGRYTLPPEHAALLTDGGNNMAPMSQMIAHLGKHVSSVADCFRNGGGVPYSAFRPEFTDVMDAQGRRRYDELLVDGYLTVADGIIDRLRDGIRVADLGCGTGHCINLMARAFPNSSFIGYDIAEDAIARGTDEAADWGLGNARFEVLDVTKVPSEPKFDLICAFDSIHDQVDPAGVLAAARAALADDGTLLVVDIKASSHVHENIGNPLTPLLYSISTLHCMTVSLAHDGAGLGTVWGTQTAQRMFAEAGFSTVEVHDAPDADPANCIYVCRP